MKTWRVLMERKSGRGKTFYEYVEAATAEEAVKIAEAMPEHKGWRVFDGVALDEERINR